MSGFTVLIVGRENVGKSSLFNKLINQQKAIVDDFPGVTRDRLYGEAEWLGKTFTVVDTGGLLFEGEDLIKAKVLENVKSIVKEADLVLFVCDMKTGLINDDKRIYEMLRKNAKDVIVVVNKADSFNKLEGLYEFHGLGTDKIIPVSAAHGYGLDDLLDEIIKKLPGEEIKKSCEKMSKIAIIGRENVGKSSLFNALLNEERSIVTDIPGTTRDSVDSIIQLMDKKYVVVDTAGVKKRKRIKAKPEAFSIGRSYANVKKADMVIYVIDAREGITDTDKKLLAYALEHYKAIILCVNKWDLVEPGRREIQKKAYIDYIGEHLKFISFCPVVFVSAKEKKGMDELVNVVFYVEKQYNFRVKTSILNKVFREAVHRRTPVSKKGVLKIYFITQVSSAPPVFTMFINKEDRMHESYLRYIENKLRESFGFAGVPIKIKLKQKERKEEE